jgi:hypothetical protein
MALLGFAIATYMDGQINFTAIKMQLIFLAAVGVLSYAEWEAQKKRVAQWATIRKKGRARFILMDFVLLRGGIFSAVLLYVLSSKVTLGLLIVVSILPVLAVIAFAANELWKRSEEEYVVASMKMAAENIKVMRN